MSINTSDCCRFKIKFRFCKIMASGSIDDYHICARKGLKFMQYTVLQSYMHTEKCTYFYSFLKFAYIILKKAFNSETFLDINFLLSHVMEDLIFNRLKIIIKSNYANTMSFGNRFFSCSWALLICAIKCCRMWFAFWLKFIKRYSRSS